MINYITKIYKGLKMDFKRFKNKSNISYNQNKYNNK